MTLAEVRTAQTDATLEVAPAGEAPDPSTTEVQEAPARPEQAGPSRTPTSPSAAPAPPGGARPPSDRGEPPDKQRRPLSPRARILAGVGVGVVLLLLIGVIVADSQTTPPADENATDGQGTTQASGGIEVDSTPVTSGDELRLTGLRAVSRRDPDPPLVGDTVTVSYSLTNVGNQPLQLESTFVGARNPAGDNINIEDMNEKRVLAPGETVNAQGRVLLDSAGAWQLWPCYLLSGERFCPDKWQVISFLAK
jgi:hypothetical protein